jgi:hypothetical protein
MSNLKKRLRVAADSCSRRREEADFHSIVSLILIEITPNLFQVLLHLHILLRFDAVIFAHGKPRCLDARDKNGSLVRAQLPLGSNYTRTGLAAIPRAERLRCRVRLAASAEMERV